MHTDRLRNLLKPVRQINGFRAVTILTLVWLATVGLDCPKPGDNPTASAHESKIDVALAGKYDQTVSVFVGEEFIGGIAKGETVSKVLQPGTYVVRIEANDEWATWAPLSVEVKAGETKTITFSTDPATLKITLGPSCAGTLNVYVDDEIIATIKDGGTATKEVNVGPHTVEIRNGSESKGSQPVEVTYYKSTYNVPFSCN